jgi:peptidoglycan/xylan/chitin deacetylase (PgdA/CDA1 family)
MLHGVMERNEKVNWDPLRKQLPPTELARVLGILSTNYQFITIEEFVDLIEGKTMPIDNALLITFDDGYRNTLDYALPVCEQFNIKPILFVTTGHINSGLPFWFDRLDYALQQNMDEPIIFNYLGVQYAFDTSSRQALIDSYKKFRDQCKFVFSNDVEMNQLFTVLAEMLESRSGKALADINVEDDWTAIASWSEIKSAVKQGRIDIGSHTVDHWRIDSLSEDEILFQLINSKEEIEARLSTECHYFCYPNGDYNQLSLDLLKQTHYWAAFTTDVGLCKSKDDLMTLKRFNFPANKTKSEILYLLNH